VTLIARRADHRVADAGARLTRVIHRACIAVIAGSPIRGRAPVANTSRPGTCPRLTARYKALSAIIATVARDKLGPRRRTRCKNRQAK
jgi:hypothetical protein